MGAYKWNVGNYIGLRASQLVQVVKKLPASLELIQMNSNEMDETGAHYTE